jgi:hypothetical protein
VLVASTDDPWLPFHRALEWSGFWKSKLVVMDRAGHINAASGYGPWPEGRELFERELGGIGGDEAPRRTRSPDGARSRTATR